MRLLAGYVFDGELRTGYFAACELREWELRSPDTLGLQAVFFVLCGLSGDLFFVLRAFVLFVPCQCTVRVLFFM
jgi:hypothetical protein